MALLSRRVRRKIIGEADSGTADERWMAQALLEAQKAAEEDEVPVGCVIVRGEELIGRGRNRVEALKDPTAHAEILAIGAAAGALNSKWLTGCSMYVSVEPCSMCAGAIVLSRVTRLVYGAADPKSGACGSVTNIVDNKSLNHRVSVRRGVLEADCRDVMKRYFKKKRVKNQEGD